MIYILFLLIFILLVVQCVALYKVYFSNKKLYEVKFPMLKKDIKEFLDFENLFKNHGIHSEGYIRVLSGNDEDDEEVMLHFNSWGCSRDCTNSKYSLQNIFFVYSGHNQYENPGRFASYRLNIDDIIDIGPINEGGSYFCDNELENYFVNCLLKDGKTVQLIFTYDTKAKDN